MHEQFRNLIAGEAVDAASGGTYDIVDPATGEVYGQAPPRPPRTSTGP